MSGAAPNCVSHFHNRLHNSSAAVHGRRSRTIMLPASEGWQTNGSPARTKEATLRESTSPRTLAAPHRSVTALQAREHLLGSTSQLQIRHDESCRTRGVSASSDSECATLRKQHRTLGFYSYRTPASKMTGEGSQPTSGFPPNVLQTMHRMHKNGKASGKRTAIPRQRQISAFAAGCEHRRNS
jgi:hypothetical protein